MAFDTSGLLEFFLAEAEEHIHTLEEGISGLQEGHDSSSIEPLFRSAHSLKGAAALVKLNVISKIAHKLEDIFEELKDDKKRIDPSLKELLLYGLDSIKEQIKRVSLGEGETPGKEEEVINFIEKGLAEYTPEIITPQVDADKIETYTKSVVTGADTPLPEKRSVGRRKEDIELFVGNFVRININQIENILNLIGEVTIKKNYLLQRIKKIFEISDEITNSGQRLLKEVSSFSDRYAYSLPGNVKYVDPLLSEFGELEFDRYDDLNLFSRKLQEMIADISEGLKGLSEFFDIFTDDLKSIDNMIKILRSEISEMRMIAIGRLFQRFSRPVKEIAEQYGKEIELIVSGGDTKVDKIIYERLFDPLMHLIRNAIIHGIEKPDKRIQKGKKSSGVIMLSARREGPFVYIDVHDNGRGIHTYRIFEEAVKLGIIRSDYKPSKQELLNLIFMPGFTTSPSADMGSGRGMGLDAVRNLIAEINGSIEVDSEFGIGTTFTIRVPSSLAITNVVVVKVHDLEFVVPLNFVEEVTEITVKDNPKRFNHRGTEIEVKRLSHVLCYRGNGTEKLSRLPLVICNITDRKVGLIVDEIVGQEETIIKPLNKFLSGLYVYSGSTISGDGRLRFVLNPLRIFQKEIRPSAQASAYEKTEARHSILVVDDSLSVRKYVSLLLQARNFNVLTATNGLEAINILEETPVDLVITDLEMPVMHGYELIQKIKKSSKWKDIPVIVLTSRSAEKHRSKAFQSGVSDYLVKPFEEMAMIDVLKKHISFT